MPTPACRSCSARPAASDCSIGPAGLFAMRGSRDPALGDPAQRGLDISFLAMLFLTSATGLLLLAAAGKPRDAGAPRRPSGSRAGAVPHAALRQVRPRHPPDDGARHVREGTTGRDRAMADDILLRVFVVSWLHFAAHTTMHMSPALRFACRGAAGSPADHVVSSAHGLAARLHLFLRARRPQQLRVRGAGGAGSVASVDRHDRPHHLGLVCRHVRRRDDRRLALRSPRPQARAGRHDDVVLDLFAAERVRLGRDEPRSRAAPDRRRACRR